MSGPHYPMGEMPTGQQIGWQATSADSSGQDSSQRQVKGQLVPTAPPLDSIGDLPGYEGTNFDGGFLPPPPPYEPPSGGGDQGPVSYNQEALTDNEARACLNQLVSENCCWGKGPANDMKIVNIAPSSAFKYTLDTFTEARETKWQYEPSDGAALAATGLQPPLPWDVPVAPQKMFKDGSQKVEVPNTQVVKPCHDCRGHGDIRCGDCDGRGHETCSSCSGTGTRIGDEQCTWCDGRGTKPCTWCHTTGMKTCSTCDGRRYLRCYVELTVTWKKHDDTFVLEKTALPDKLVKSASGQVAFSDEQPRVAPVAGFLDPQIGQASQDLVHKHATKWPNERILMQRHSVEIVPVNAVEYILDGKEGVFHIYGNENKVHFPDYPSQCCGCCVLM
ncbi:protein SSUH2 homolog [Amphibalanus amphitrite]|uniref:protein SSUH2 homolog n=1 Tax=Amphibalanus amphitrite TaxID=1232801 RepID=UPI001C91FCBD|nr:protein SSUH2 homolog [Amphibalanus amphitrite]